MFGEIISVVVRAFSPVDEKLALFNSVFDPIKPHVHSLAPFLFHRGVYYPDGASIVGLDWGGWLRVA